MPFLDVVAPAAVIVVFLAVVFDGCTAQPDVTPWLRACENSLLPQTSPGAAPLEVGALYYVLQYHIDSSTFALPNNLTMILSLCNRTNKSPRNTVNCGGATGISVYWAAVWNASSGSCMQAWNIMNTSASAFSIHSAAVVLTSTNVVGSLPNATLHLRMVPSNTSSQVNRLLTIASSTTPTAAGIAQGSTTMVAESSDFTPFNASGTTTPPPTASNQSHSDNFDGGGGETTKIAVICTISIGIPLIGSLVYVLCRLRKRLETENKAVSELADFDEDGPNQTAIVHR